MHESKYRIPPFIPECSFWEKKTGKLRYKRGCHGSQRKPKLKWLVLMGNGRYLCSTALGNVLASGASVLLMPCFIPLRHRVALSVAENSR